jgi:threonine/homoserine/homoserine lactone efflux protein
MESIIAIYLLAVAVGLSGALAPGPMLVATIDSSLRGGWTMGPRVTAGHMAVEFVLIILIAAGLSAGAASYSGAIALAGGVALVGFGILTMLSAFRRQKTVKQGKFLANPFLAGILTTAANPYFWVWWVTVGSALLLSWTGGVLVLGAVFMAGHWTADLGWYTLVSTGTARGRAFLSPDAYQALLVVCSAFLILFGFYFILCGN